MRSPGAGPGLRYACSQEQNATATHFQTRAGAIRRPDSRDLTQATFLAARVMPSLIGSAASVATFWASVASSRLWADSVSNCLRAWAVESSITSDSDLAANSSLA